MVSCFVFLWNALGHPSQLVDLLLFGIWMGRFAKHQMVVVGRLSLCALCGPFGNSEIDELLKALNDL